MEKERSAVVRKNTRRMGNKDDGNMIGRERMHLSQKLQSGINTTNILEGRGVYI